jgi:hypothetical protein
MKSYCVLLSWLVASLGPLAAADAPEIQLLGIFQNEGRRFAVLQLKQPRPQESILSEGDMDQHLTVIAVHPTSATVRRNGASEDIELKLAPGGGDAGADRALDLRDVPAPTLLYIYQMLSHRTVLGGPGIPLVNLTVAASATALMPWSALAGGDTQALGMSLSSPFRSRSESLSSLPPPPPVNPAGTTVWGRQMMNFAGGLHR